MSSDLNHLVKERYLTYCDKTIFDTDINHTDSDPETFLSSPVLTRCKGCEEGYKNRIVKVRVVSS